MHANGVIDLSLKEYNLCKKYVKRKRKREERERERERRREISELLFNGLFDMANIDQTPFFVRCKMQFRHFAGIKTFFVERAINAKMVKK